MSENPLDEYFLQLESNQGSALTWRAAIGLQDTDGLKPSNYLIELANRNISGEISLQDTENLLNLYYAQRPAHEPENRTEEADKVASRIARLLTEPAFTFSSNYYLSIHKELFTGIYRNAGKVRTFNLTKKEWVLDGATVIYGSARQLQQTLDYDFEVEKNFDYKGLSTDEIIQHLAKFISNVWQAHVFEEGNTRTTAVFLMKYLRSLGFKPNEDLFSAKSWFFRNALVRANYENLPLGIHETTEYLELFIRNLVLGEENTLSNRLLHIYGDEILKQKQDIGDKNQDIHYKNQDIENENRDIQHKNQDIDNENQDIDTELPAKTRRYLELLRQELNDKVFGRSEVMEVLSITASPASALLARLRNAGEIVAVSGAGKGKYRLKKNLMSDLTLRN